jgi:hypothetical protein
MLGFAPKIGLRHVAGQAAVHDRLESVLARFSSNPMSAAMRRENSEKPPVTRQV